MRAVMCLTIVIIIMTFTLAWSYEAGEIKSISFPKINAEILYEINQGVPVDFNWSDTNKISYRLRDPMGILMGFEVVKYQELDLDTKSLSNISSENANIRYSTNRNIQLTLDSKYSFTYAANKKKVDTSTFTLKIKGTEEDWKAIKVFKTEPMDWTLSPDGKLIAFSIEDKISIIDLEGNLVKEISEASGSCRAPRFGKTSNILYYFFRAEEGKPSAIFKTYIKTGDQMRIIKNNGIDGLSVSPTEQFLAYTIFTNKVSVLYLKDILNDKNFKLTLPGCSDGNPIFSPDGKWLGFYHSCEKKNSLQRIDVINFSNVAKKGKGKNVRKEIH